MRGVFGGFRFALPTLRCSIEKARFLQAVRLLVSPPRFTPSSRSVWRIKDGRCLRERSDRVSPGPARRCGTKVARSAAQGRKSWGGLLLSPFLRPAIRGRARKGLRLPGRDPASGHKKTQRQKQGAAGPHSRLLRARRVHTVARREKEQDQAQHAASAHSLARRLIRQLHPVRHRQKQRLRQAQRAGQRAKAEGRAVLRQQRDRGARGQGAKGGLRSRP